jgi:hypothetical protein
MDSSQNIFLEKVQEQYQRVLEKSPFTIEIVSIDNSNNHTHYTLCNNNLTNTKNNTYTIYITSNPKKLSLPLEGNNYILSGTSKLIEILDYISIYSSVFVEKSPEESEDIYDNFEIVSLENTEGEYIY